MGGAALCCWSKMSSGVGSILVGVGGRKCVDRTLDLCWSKSPICMVMDCGGWRRTCADVRPGNIVHRPASIASQQMERTGEKVRHGKI
jgi:hypothetical protein